jgi:predicted metal-binding membrane protein
MQGAARWLVPFWIAIASAWLLLALGESVLSLPAFCSAGGIGALPLSASFDLALLTNALPHLASGWLPMVIAMMLPLAIAPIEHVRERSFARRQVRSMLLFVAGFVALWIVAGVVLGGLAWLLRGVMPAPISVGLAIVAALLWQVSPAKQWCLNRCHQRPPLAAFGFAADTDAVRFGVTNGAACAGTCWALMLPMLLIGQGQLAAMIAVTLFSLAESLEKPAPLTWRWRGGGKALRIVAAWWPVHRKEASSSVSSMLGLPSGH